MSVCLLKQTDCLPSTRRRFRITLAIVILHVVAVVQVNRRMCSCNCRDDVEMQKLWWVWSNANSTLSCCLSGVWWTRRTSWATSSRSRCLRKCGTGWPPPSPARWAWCCDATRRNPASAASCTPSRPEYLWRGEFVCECVCVRCTEASSSLMLENTYWLLPLSLLRPGATQSNTVNILWFCSWAHSAACPACFLALTLMPLGLQSIWTKWNLWVTVKNINSRSSPQ